MFEYLSAGTRESTSTVIGWEVMGPLWVCDWVVGVVVFFTGGVLGAVETCLVLFLYLDYCLSVSTRGPVIVGLTHAVNGSPGRVVLDRLTTSVGCVPLRAASSYLVGGRFCVVRCANRSVVADNVFRFGGRKGFLGEVKEGKRKPRRCLRKLFTFNS